MVDHSDKLPELSEDSDLKTLLMHTQAGNVAGFMVCPNSHWVDRARAERYGRAAGVGKAIVELCNRNKEAPSSSPEYTDSDDALGTDLAFSTDDDTEANRRGPLLVELLPEDAAYLLENIPLVIMGQRPVTFSD